MNTASKIISSVTAVIIVLAAFAGCTVYQLDSSKNETQRMTACAEAGGTWTGGRTQKCEILP